MTIKVKSCKFCGRDNHSAFNCPRRPRKPLQTRTRLKPIGKVTKKWLNTRDKWLEVNKAAYYVCYYCPRVMTRSQLTLDHKESRSRRPDLRYNWKNLVPCCAPCNQAKGSLSAEEFIKLKGNHV